MCLESLLHHSTIKNYAKDIVLLNGLPLLMEIHNRFKNDLDINITLCNILSNISMYPELLENLYRTGIFIFILFSKKNYLFLSINRLDWSFGRMGKRK